jgi:hypothetical protein
MNWQVVEAFKGGCPVTPARVLSFNDSPMDTEGCRAWGDQANLMLAAEAPDYVFTSSWAGAFSFDPDRERSLEIGSQAFAQTWSAWADAGARVFILRDVPTTGGRKIPECLQTHPGDPLACARPRSEAVRPDAATLAVERLAARHGASDRIRQVDLTDLFCDADTCYAAIGGALVYYDYNHITAQFSRSLAPYLLERLRPGLG